MLGGSVAGLLAARVLSDHADSVVVVEPDTLGADQDAIAGGNVAIGEFGGARRSGVPQGAQLHALLGMGRLQLDRWFPGMSDELLADGAVLCEGPRVHQYVDGRRKIVIPGHDLISSTRPFLEARIQRRVLGLDNVTAVRGRVVGLRFCSGSRGRVVGAYYLPAGEPDCARRECLAADFVVDATGRSSRLGVWLEKAGWRAPALERIRIDLGYATAGFRRGAELPDVRALTSLAGPAPAGKPQPDAAALAEVEGGRWMLVLAAYGDRRPTDDPQAFLARCRAVAAAPVREVADSCEPLGPLAVHRVPDSRRRDFLGLPGFPGGLVAVGDAAASFNPVYGQGMTSAALHASCLSAYLRSGAAVDEPARGYFERLRVVVDAAWNLSALGDLAQPHVNGPYPKGYRAAKWYSELLLRATMTDPEVNRRFLDVVNMCAHPRLLSRPGTALRVAQALWAQSRA